MTRLQEFLQRACNELGLQIEIPFTLVMQSGCSVLGQALLPQLGAKKGMIVVENYDDLCGKTGEIMKCGYGYSVLDAPLPQEEYDRDLYVELFSDWGWGKADEARPGWMM